MIPAYIQPGDHVYVAIPVSPSHRTLEAAIAEGKQQADGLEATLAHYGVTLAGWSSHSQLTHPVVVAVFRNPPASPSTEDRS